MVKETDVSKIFAALRAAIKGGNKVQKLVREALVAQDQADIIAAAVAIDEKFPPKPVEKTGADGKTREVDANRDERNDYLRNLRMALMRAGRELGVRLTIKKVEGAWQIQSEPLTPSQQGGDEGEGGESGEGRGEGSGDMTEAQGDALWAAVELVLANLDNAAVLSAIRSGLEAKAKARAQAVKN